MPGTARLDDAIGGKFDLLIELITDHSFVARRQTVTNIGDFKYASIAMTIFGLLLAAGITWILRSRIVRPLRAAASVADRIAGGEIADRPSRRAGQTRPARCSNP